MSILLVTNDFPPTVGGIQSYLRDFAAEVVRHAGTDNLIVFASTLDAAAAAQWDASVDYTVIRARQKVLLPTPAVRAQMQRIIREFDVDTVWFGAAAPLAVLGSAARSAGAQRVVATTHGHEVGWSMVPGARSVLRRIGDSADVVTYISRYTLGRFRPAVGEKAQYVALPSGVDTNFFRPAKAAQRLATRQRWGLGEAPVIVCASRLVARKGQDQLIRALPEIRRRCPGAVLVIIGAGSYGTTLRRYARHLEPADRDAVIFTGPVERPDMRDLVAAADVFAMPARTRGGGLDVEGLGIVYLEAQACAVPVVAGDSGGAPEAVGEGAGVVVDGRDLAHIVESIAVLLNDATCRTSMGKAGREFVERHFSWDELGRRCYRVLTPQG
ncbi:glycosyltransferase family 4 protein [Corynebacterium sp.]|uniref:glycosyltransferase family 4 protein n=1 Tax=Corynebacterium sp. TaxID=1720 RepID=UPI002A90B9C6|nr:glycosyltransferase family 4 protein [Corynebacterium sp.]MDY5784626.1 glycosyltransferase family 4 protein [Corynebacterium sp.]